MKKELVVLNELSFLFNDNNREYKIKYSNYLTGLNKGNLIIEIDFTKEESGNVISILKNKVIDGHGVLVTFPVMYGDGELINKCIDIVFVEECDMDKCNFEVY